MGPIATELEAVTLPESLLGFTYGHFRDRFQGLTGRGDVFARPLYRQVFLEGRLVPEAHPVFVGREALCTTVHRHFTLLMPRLDREVREEGTRKLLFATPDNLRFESVLIPMKDYATLCISSQVGCAMGCVFCETASMGRVRNLSASEIVSQLYYVRHVLKEPVRNVVFMGMGEPLDNWEAVLAAIRVFTDVHGFCMSLRHITVSTSGKVDGMDRLAAEGGLAIPLAISLNAGNDPLRDSLMPINRRYPLGILKAALKRYPVAPRGVFFIEYVLIDGVNDSVKDADEVAAFCAGLPVRVNLIPCNPGRLGKYHPSSVETQEQFYQRLRAHGLHVTRRTTKGLSILAACGQLAVTS